MPPTPVPKVDEDACLQAHNAKRALHQNTPALVWDATLAQHAKDWADHLAEIGSLQHAQVTGQGENLYWAGGSSVASCADAVQSWYNEVSLYDYSNPPEIRQEFNAGGYGHFTQVIWKGTTRVGAALKKIVNSQGYTETYIVARYSPQGNIIGQFDANVKPEK
ncbi:ectin-like [Oculina patagonica]